MTPNEPRRPHHGPGDDPETSSFPPIGDDSGPVAYQPQYVPGHGDSRGRGRSGLAVVLMILLVAGAIGLGAWVYSSFLSGVGEDSAAPASPVTTTVTVPAETTPEGESPEEPTSEVTTVTETSTPGFRAPGSAEQCAANVNWRIFRASDVTSCGFAENVAIAMAGNSGVGGAHVVEAVSPATGESYSVRCEPEGDNSFTCRGGTDAVVVLEARAVRD